MQNSDTETRLEVTREGGESRSLGSGLESHAYQPPSQPITYSELLAKTWSL